ncbi:bifunctional phosphoribosyl-AMP cyclohydrolase/phosphoribosyl-ATP diphosphatase HisIE [Adhaeribacter radiodurans]|uniref:Histidine biosynthesis bifunctional protein HisIE n=1 Tax=Adhaeribacter radiodurans TaxID=2745197 RepID=A0A7L7L6K8_9BACT|nr:bifunctional phosphoribosyl-AMP cyclohydrolase/phosphoribosyl-ATP diphosphatase HisIE [Adhaeribacter radiodurans]QMU28440.1 bifunctional phosphoribosyl-AMP cyclohydrolase/phosphoribosyl-ATP diphosphatase HisIE [Adhaeribacter radiodurans]
MLLDFAKAGGLLPVVIQDNSSQEVLMVGFMNQEAYEKTQQEKVVTFYSRTKNRLWTKGETSGNFLHVVSIQVDCDQDTLLIKANPVGPVCHTGARTCFEPAPDTNTSNTIPTPDVFFLKYLENLIQDRRKNPQEKSYTNLLFEKGIQKIAQKVGEEAVETVIDAVAGNKERLKEEAADLLYHLLVLLAASDLQLSDVIQVLQKRHQK